MALVSCIFILLSLLQHAPESGTQMSERVAPSSSTQVQHAAIIGRVLIVPHKTHLSVVALASTGRSACSPQDFGLVSVILRIGLPSTHLIHQALYSIVGEILFPLWPQQRVIQVLILAHQARAGYSPQFTAANAV